MTRHLVSSRVSLMQSTVVDASQVIGMFLGGNYQQLSMKMYYQRSPGQFQTFHSIFCSIDRKGI
jgi:hypothetical protein